MNQSAHWHNSQHADLLRFPNAELRAKVIAQHVRLTMGHKRVVVFTAGNAAEKLREQGLDVVEVGPKGWLQPSRWWTPKDVAQMWPDRFDATAGHLPVAVLDQLGAQYKAWLGDLTGQWFVPTGSGETILCLHKVYPHVSFCAVYDNSNPETSRDNDQPLNAAVDALFPVQYWHGLLQGIERGDDGTND